MPSKSFRYFLFLSFFCFSLLIASVPSMMTYQGKVTNIDGIGITDTLDIAFSLWNADTSGDSLWGETQPNVPIIKGLFDVQLGSVNPIALSFDTTYWLQIIVDGDKLLPRTQLTTSPYSYRAAIADSVDGSGANSSGWIDDGNIVRLSTANDSVGIGTDTPAQKFHLVSPNYQLAMTYSIGSEGLNSGIVAPATAVSDNSNGGSAGWVNPTDAITSNNVHAYSMLAISDVSEYLKLTNFGFSIPDWAVVDGIEVRIERKASDASSISDYEVRLIKAGVPSGDDKAAAGFWPTDDGFMIYGGSSDLWGTSWSPADGNNLNFGVAISATASAPAIARIDFVSITLYYSTTSEWTTGIDHSDFKISNSVSISSREVLKLNNDGGALFSGRVAGSDAFNNNEFITKGQLAGGMLSDQWATSGTNIYNTNTGNVGIGRTNPLKKLDVYMANGIVAQFTGNGYGASGNTYLGIKDSSANVKWYLQASDDGSFALHQDGAGERITINDDDGWVGIGTTTPDEKLEVYRGDCIVNGLTFGRGGGYVETNTAAGNLALYNNKGKSRNTAIGYQAMYYADSASTVAEARNTAVGYQALMGTIYPYQNTGKFNTAVGDQALYSNASGEHNTAVGVGAIRYNSTGIDNTAVGHSALYYNSTGNKNSAFGYNAGYNTNYGSNNVAIGYKALYSNKDNSRSTAVGVEAMYYADQRSSEARETCNTAVGCQALYGSNNPFNNTGQFNTAIGDQAIFSNTSGRYNSALGAASLIGNTTGDLNTASGYRALYSNNEGYQNTASGSYALYSNTLGDCNTALGYMAFYSGADDSNSTALGYNTQITASNQVRIGNSNVTSIGGQVGWTTLSDSRFKRNIGENVTGLSFIKKLRPITYNLDVDALDDFLGIPDSYRLKGASDAKSKIVYTGFIAQEVEQAAREAGYNFSGVDAPKNEKDYYGLRYAEFVVPLVKAVQEQQAIIDKQQEQINELLERIKLLEHN